MPRQKEMCEMAVQSMKGEMFNVIGTQSEAEAEVEQVNRMIFKLNVCL